MSPVALLLCDSLAGTAAAASRWQQEDFASEAIQLESIYTLSVSQPEQAARQLWGQLQDQPLPASLIGQTPVVLRQQMASLVDSTAPSTPPVQWQMHTSGDTLIGFTAAGRYTPLPGIANFRAALRQLSKQLPQLQVQGPSRGELDATHLLGSDLARLQLEISAGVGDLEKQLKGPEEAPVAWAVGLSAVCLVAILTLLMLYYHKPVRVVPIMTAGYFADQPGHNRLVPESMLALGAAMGSYEKSMPRRLPVCDAGITQLQEISEESTGIKAAMFKIHGMCVLAFKANEANAPASSATQVPSRLTTVGCRSLSNTDVSHSGDGHCRVSAAVLDSFRSIHARVDAYVNESCPLHTRLLTVGHSQGGALATVVAYALGGERKVDSITFGSPKVGDRQFAHYYKMRVGATLRFVEVMQGMLGHRYEDEMATVPSDLRGFEHVVMPTHLKCVSGEHKCHLLTFYHESLEHQLQQHAMKDNCTTYAAQN